MKRSVSVRVSKWAQIIFIWTVAVVFFAPLCLAVTNSFKPRSEIMASALSLPTSLYLDNYRTVMEDDYFLSSFITSVLMVAATTSLTCLIAAMAGYALARWKCRFSNGLTLVIMSTLFVPFQVYMVALIVIVRQIGLTGNLIGLLLVYIALGMPVPIFLVRSYATGMSLEIEEAATIDGCGRLRMLGAIVLPLMKPVLATVAVLNALWVWGRIPRRIFGLRDEEAHDAPCFPAVLLWHLQQPVEPDSRGLRYLNDSHRDLLSCHAAPYCQGNCGRRREGMTF